MQTPARKHSTPSLAAPSPLARLRRMSRWMRALIALGAAALLISEVLGGSKPPASMDSSPLRELGAAAIAPSVHPGSDLQTALALVNLPGLLLALLALWQAWRLFGAYGRGQVFGPAAVRPLRALAWTLIATSLWHIAAQTLGTLLLTWHNPPGQRQLTIGLSWDDYLGALFGGLLIAMAWAMAEAARIEQDNAGFI